MMVSFVKGDQYKFFDAIENIKKPGIILTRMRTFKHFEKMTLTEGSKKMLDIPNAGGNSVISEVLSNEFLNLVFNGELLKTEMEISYFPIGSKITDYSMIIFGKAIGVSVTRAMHFKGDEFFTEQHATHLLKKKLNGIYWSSRNVVRKDKWEKQILHVWCTSMSVAKKVKSAYRKLNSSIRGNSIIILTIVANAPYIFSENANTLAEMNLICKNE
jgi:hypothetical protein